MILSKIESDMINSIIIHKLSFLLIETKSNHYGDPSSTAIELPSQRYRCKRDIQPSLENENASIQ